MKKKLWTLLVVLVMAAVSAGVLLVVGRYVAGHIFGQGPREPKSDVPVIYQITRGSGGSDIEIKKFEVNVLQAPLNLFNSRALVQIAFEGTIKGQREWKPFIDAVQMSERYKTLGKHESLDIEAEPRMDYKEEKQYQGERIPFHLKIEYIVTAWKWGENRIDFHTRGINETIVLHHPK